MTQTGSDHGQPAGEPLIGDGVYHRTARAAAEADPVFRRFCDEGAKDEIPRAEAWLQQTGPAIIAQLTAATPGRPP